MSRKWIAVLTFVLALALGTGWYLASPYWAMSGLRDAAIEGDADALEDRVDFPSVRESLKSQLRAVIQAEIAKRDDDNPFAALGGMIAMNLADGVVDRAVTPDGIAVLMEKGRIAKRDESAAPGDDPEQKVEWTIERSGFNHFRAHPVAEPGEKVPNLVFRRDGLGWTLTEIEMAGGGIDGDAGVGQRQ